MSNTIPKPRRPKQRLWSQQFTKFVAIAETPPLGWSETMASIVHLMYTKIVGRVVVGGWTVAKKWTRGFAAKRATCEIHDLAEEGSTDFEGASSPVEVW